MKEKVRQKIDAYNKRVDALYHQVCGWLKEENIQFQNKESGITLTEAASGAYKTKRLDVFTKDEERLFSLVPIGAWIINAEGAVELEGDSGAERLVYIHEEQPADNRIESEKEKILNKLSITSKEEGWHWVDERIIGKKPLLKKEVFQALLERIN